MTKLTPAQIVRRCPDCRESSTGFCKQHRPTLTPEMAADAERIVEAHKHVPRRRVAYVTTKPKRGYSKDFTPNKDTGRRYLLDNIPAALWIRVQAKCTRTGISRRAIILQLLDSWSTEQ